MLHKTYHNHYTSLENGLCFELNELGIDKATISVFQNNIGICKERQTPIFIYQDFQNNINGYSWFSSTYSKSITEVDKESFFFKAPLLHYSLITHIIICPNPTELLSYYQLHNKKFKDTTLLISHHPYHNISEYSILPQLFKSASYSTLYPKGTPSEILTCLNLHFALSNISYQITQEKNNISIKVKQTTYTTTYHNIDKDFFRKVLQQDKMRVKNILPPKYFNTFNEVIS